MGDVEETAGFESEGEPGIGEASEVVQAEAIAGS